jgi:hypothetical protein
MIKKEFNKKSDAARHRFFYWYNNNYCLAGCGFGNSLRGIISARCEV